MAKSTKRQWRIRKTLRGDGVGINVAADVNYVSSQGGSASSVQRSRIVQGKSAETQKPDKRYDSKEENDD